MVVKVGIDVAKHLHWVVAITDDGRVLINRKLENTPTAIGALTEELRDLDEGSVMVGVDVRGGIAGLLVAMLDGAGISCVHVPGLAVNRARQGTRGGENKTEPRDARVIADQLRIRDDLRRISAAHERDIALHVLTGRREELVQAQTARINRLRDLLCSIHPGLERAVDPVLKADLILLTKYVTPAQIRAAGVRRVAAFLAKHDVRDKRAQALAEAAHAAAAEQRVTVAGEVVMAEMIRELATEALAARDRIRHLDKQLEEALDQHPDAAVTRSLPGMGVVLTAEFHAEVSNLDRFPSGDHLAAASGLAPAIQQSGKVRYLRRAAGGNRRLKRIFYQSAFCALTSDPASKTFYARKRKEGKTHQQAVIALARRRINVLHAMLRSHRTYDPDHARAA